MPLKSILIPTIARKASKAIGAGVGGLLGAGGTHLAVEVTDVIPPEVQMPWWAWLIVYAIATLAPAIGAYRAPKNVD